MSLYSNENINTEQAEREATKVLRELEQKLKLENATFKNKTTGSINRKRINRELCKNRGFLMDNHLFNQRIRAKATHSVIVLFDNSGSMNEKFNQELNRLDAGKNALYSLSLVLIGLKIPFAIYGFCSQNNTGETTLLREIKGFNEKAEKNAIRERLNRLTFARGYMQNNDAMAIYGGLELLQKQGTQKKLMIVISDGQPHSPISCENFRLDIVTNDSIRQANRRVKTLAFSLSDEANAFLKTSAYNEKIYLNKDTQQNISKNLVKAYLRAIK